MYTFFIVIKDLIKNPDIIFYINLVDIIFYYLLAFYQPIYLAKSERGEIISIVNA
jgi:hypothetical protein